MALYVDSAYLDDITPLAQIVPLVGVTTNPTILLAAYERGQKMDIDSLIRDLLNVGESLFMQPGSLDEEEMYQQAMMYWNAGGRVLGSGSSLAERIVHKIPMTQTGMRVARRLRQENYRARIAFTAVTTVAQAYTAAMLRANFIIPYYNRLMRAGVDANERISEMAEVLHNQQLSTRILAASIKTPSEATSALLAGAHDITAAPSVLLEMVNDPQTDEAIEKFAQDWQKMKKL